MTGLRFGGRRENGLGQPVAFAQAGGQGNPADGSVLAIFFPPGAGKIAARDTLDGKHLGAANQH